MQSASKGQSGSPVIYDASINKTAVMLRMMKQLSDQVSQTS